MAAGEHDAAYGLRVMSYRPAEGRRRAVILRQDHAEPVLCGYLGRKGGVGVGILATIMTYVEGPGLFGGGSCLNGCSLEDAGGGIGYLHDVGAGEIVSDDGAPAIGSEMDGGGSGVCHVQPFDRWSFHHYTVLIL